MSTQTELLREAVETLRGMVDANAAKWDMPHDEFCTEYMAWSKNRARALLAKIDASKGEVPLPLSALVCVGRARFPRTGGNAGISWHVEDALSDTGGFRSGNPCNGELLFVLPATAKRAMLAASGRQDGAR